MTTLAASLGQVGPGTSQVIGGKTWTLTRSTKKIQADWGKWFADRVESANMDTASNYRKKARAIWRDIKKLEDESFADLEPTPERGAELAALIEDGTKEAQFLEFEARQIMQIFNDRKAAGEFEYHGNASLGVAMQNLPGQFQLAWLCLLPKHPGLTLEELIEAYQGHAKEWGEFLVRSEGAQKKDAPPPAASTPASMPTEPTTSKTSTSTPTPPPAALP